MTNFFNETGKYELQYIFKIYFTQNQQKNISEPNLTNTFFVEKKLELDSLPLVTGKFLLRKFHLGKFHLENSSYGKFLLMKKTM